MKNENRITSNHVSQRGNFGYSNLSHGERVSKGSGLPKIYASVDRLQHLLGEFLNDYDTFSQEFIKPDFYEILDENILNFLRYLLECTYSLNSFIYSAGEQEWTKYYLFDEAVVDFMDSEIQRFRDYEMSKNIKDTEFIVCTNIFNFIRLSVREVEASFWEYRDERRVVWQNRINQLIEKLDYDSISKDSSEVLLHDMTSKYLESRNNFLAIGQVLNKLSSYFYSLQRYVELHKSPRIKEWSGVAPKLSQFISQKYE